MANSSDKKELQRWRKIASTLAMVLAVTLLASGVVGGWISFENRTLGAYKSNNEKLRDGIKNVTENLASTNDELKECKETIKEHEKKIDGLETKIESLKTEEELLEDLEKCEKKNKELMASIFKLNIENANLKALLDK